MVEVEARGRPLVVALVVTAALLGGCTTTGSWPAPRGQQVVGEPAPDRTRAVAGSAVVDTAVVGGRASNLRAGPSTSFRIVGGAQPGTALDVYGRERGWLEVGNGRRTAWIAASLTREPATTIAVPVVDTEPAVARPSEPEPATAVPVVPNAAVVVPVDRESGVVVPEAALGEEASVGLPRF